MGKNKKWEKKRSMVDGCMVVRTWCVTADSTRVGNLVIPFEISTKKALLRTETSLRLPFVGSLTFVAQSGKSDHTSLHKATLARIR